jgi:hypothetical protein
MEDTTMSKAAVIRYETKPEAAEENQRLVEEVFAALDKVRPEGLRYTTLRLEDGVTFVHVVLTEGDADPLPELPEFQAFAQGIGERIVSPPVRGGAQVVGSYRFLSE